MAHNGILSLLMKRKVTGNEAITTLKHWLSHTSQYTVSLIKNCIDKTFDVGADVKTFNKAINEIIVAEHGVMLCEPASKNYLTKSHIQHLHS